LTKARELDSENIIDNLPSFKQLKQRWYQDLKINQLFIYLFLGIALSLNALITRSEVLPIGNKLAQALSHNLIVINCNKHHYV